MKTLTSKLHAASGQIAVLGMMYLEPLRLKRLPLNITAHSW